MNKQTAIALLALLCLLMVATIIGCGSIPGINLPGGGSSGGMARFAFVVNSQTDSTITGLTISVYSVDATSGKLTPVSGSPFVTKASGCCGTVFVDASPSGNFLFVPNRQANSVSVFSIGSTGALTEISGSPFMSGGSDVYEAEVSPDGRFLYVSNEAPSSVSTGGSTGSITAFSVASTGALTMIGTVNVAFSPRHLFMDPQGRFLYAGDQTEGGFIDAYTIKSDGSLAPINGTPFRPSNLSCPRSGRVDDSGKFLLVADKCSDNVFVFSIDQTTGALTNVNNPAGGAGFPGGSEPFGVLEIPIGNTIYMAVNDMGDGTISVFTFDGTTGMLTPVSGSPFNSLNLSRPHFMDLASANFGYVADYNNSNIVGLTLGTNGNPTPIAGSPFSGGGIAAPSQIIFSH